MTEAEEKKPIQKITEKAQEAAHAETAPAPVRRYRSYVLYVSLLIVTAAFGVLTFLVKVTPSFPIDLRITVALQSIQYAWFAWLMTAISWPGFAPQNIIITVMTILLLLEFGLRWESISAVAAATFTELVDLLVKDLIRRPRPAGSVIHVLAKVTGFSFPSGHVMYYVGYFGFLGFLAFTLLKPSIKRSVILLVIGFLIATIGASRIYEGEHWPSDALGAYLLGFLTLVASVTFYRWGKRRFFVRQPVAKPAPSEVVQKS